MTGRASVTINVISNYAGTLWAALVQVFLVPLYIRLLGVESYGLIGFFVTMQAVLQVFDFGLAPAVNRQMARCSALGPPGTHERNLLRTLELFYWGVGAAIGMVISGASTLLATRWMRVEALPIGQVETAISLMGLTIAFQWSIACYGGALMGLQRQPVLNGLRALFFTLSGLGAAAVLILVSPTLPAFFAWRAGVSLLEAVATRAVLWRALDSGPDARQARFRLEAFRGIWRFSLGMTVITLTAVILMQVDKVILSKVLSMEQFGLYMVAASVAGFLPQLVTPVFTAVFPSLSRLVTSHDAQALKEQFHLSAQVVTVIVHPIAVTFVLFSYSIIRVWTNDERLATASGPVLSFLALGVLLNSLMVLPYALQLAHGWTKLGMTINLVLVALMVPYAVFAARNYGIVGAASTWTVLNALYLMAGAPLTFRRLLPGEGLRWFGQDLLVPGGAIVVAAGVVRFLAPEHASRLLMAMSVAAAISLAYLAGLATSPLVRRKLLTTLATLRRGLSGDGLSS